MKVKTSVTLSESLLRDIDEVAGPGCNRSAVLEEAAREWVWAKQRDQVNKRDAEIFAALTPDQIGESDVLDYSIDPMELGDQFELSDDVLRRIAAEDAAGAAG